MDPNIKSLDLNNSLNSPIGADGGQDISGVQWITLGKSSLVHQRINYTIMDVLAEFGGLAIIIKAIFTVLLHPIARHHFNVRAISKLYLAKANNQIFAETTNPRVIRKDDKERKFL